MNRQERIERAHDRMGALILAHFKRRQELECQTLSCILADPLKGRALVEPFGLKCCHFDDDDFKLIYAAVLVWAERGKTAVIKLAYKVLLQAKHIDDMSCESSGGDDFQTVVDHVLGAFCLFVSISFPCSRSRDSPD